MTTTTDPYAITCEAEASVNAIPVAGPVTFESGRVAVRVAVELEVIRCDRDLDDPYRQFSYLDLPVGQAETLAWQILTAVDELRLATGEA